MTRLLAGILVVALSWMGVWAAASLWLDRQVTTFLNRPQDGVRIAASDVAVRGFPSRLDTTVTDVDLTFEEAGVTWHLPFVQVLTLIYRPNEVIAVWPDTHSVETALQTVEITQARARASLAADGFTEPELDRATLVVEDLLAISNLGWEVGVDETRASVARTGERTYRTGLEILGLVPRFGASVEPLDRAYLDASVQLSDPLDRGALDQPPGIEALDIDALALEWPGMSLTARGDIAPDPDGTAEGALDLSITGWERLFDLAIETGAIDTEFTPALRAALSALADGDSLDVTLTLERGFMALGPLPLGPAPRMVPQRQ